MYETLLRPHGVAQIPQPPSIAEISAKLKEAEKVREEKRLRQIANNHARLTAAAATAGAVVDSGNEAVSSTSGSSTTKRKRDQDDPKLSDDITAQSPAVGDSSPGTKRIKTEEEEGTETEAGAVASNIAMDVIKAEDVVVDESRPEITKSASTPVSTSRLSVSNALPDVRGHTSYLTFAVLVPFTAPVGSSGGIKEDIASLPSLLEFDKSSIGPS